MISNLRERLNAAHRKVQAAPPKETACLVLEQRTPLAEMRGVEGVTAESARRLGLDLPAFSPREALFLDTETTGLHGAGTVAFLIGVGYLEGDAFVVRQFLMRDYPEEASALLELSALLPRFTSVVTFNGKSFDVPLLRDRFTLARLRDQWRELPHLDLLHAARRTWKLRLGSCTLGALENRILGSPREDDLPGAEVPERFFRYLKTRDMSLLNDVLRHNAQDIVSLGVLLAHLSKVYCAPDEQLDLLDVFSAGRALERIGEGELARRCFRVASVSALSQQARLHLAQSYRREKNFESAAEEYRLMVERGEGGPHAYIQLAILLERRLGAPREALVITEKALWRFSGESFLHPCDRETLAALERRRARLKKSLEG